MIIWGSRGITSTVEQGNFHCPRCQVERIYCTKQVRRFFTLYFVPLFPIGAAQVYVECQTCLASFYPEVLGAAGGAATPVPSGTIAASSAGLAGELYPAVFWKRFMAGTIDLVLTLSVTYLLSRVLGPGVLPTLASWVLPWLYFAYLESSPRQASLGKQLLGLAVVDEHGARLSFAHASGRYLAKAFVASGLTFGLGLLAIAFTAKRQGLHDKLVRTLVLDRRHASVAAISAAAPSTSQVAA